METYIEIREPMISADDLEKRWPGLLASEIAEGIDSAITLFTDHPGKISDFPTPYFLKKVLQDNAGNAIAYCSPCTRVKPYFIHDDETYEWGSIFFKLSDVVRYENAHTDVFCAIVHPDEAWATATAGANGEIPHAGLATLSANEVINRLKITPIELVDILNGVTIYDDYNNFVATRRLVTTDEADYRAHTYSEPYFTEGALKSVKIYQLDFDRYCEEWGVQEHAQSETVDTSGLESRLAEAQKQIESLRQGNNRLNEQNQELRAELAAAQETQPSAADPALTPQQKASLTRQENTLNAWKPAIAAMIKVAVRCGDEGKKRRQRPDFNLMFNELDAELNGEQEKFFRECLPDEHIDRLGDARGKTDPPDNV